MKNDTYNYSDYIDDCTIRNLDLLGRRDDILAVIQLMEIVNEKFMNAKVKFELTVPVENKIDETLASEVYLIMTNTKLNLVSRDAFKDVHQIRIHLARLNRLGLVI